MKFSNYNKLFVFCAVFLNPWGSAFADSCQCGWTTCATNQRCVEEYYWDQEEQIWDYDYYCVDCPSGQVHSSSDCYQCVAQPCQGYTDCPSGIGGSGKKCKVVANGCPSGSGCTKYEICDTSNNAVTYQATSGCHLEGYRKDICQPNTVPCSIFSIDHFAIGWNCEQNTQVGEATWQPDKSAWDTKNCSCEFTNRDLTSHESPDVAAYFHCKSANARHHVLDADRYSTTEVDSAVRYSFDWEYCSKCKAGYIPEIQPAVSNDIYLRPDHNGSWGVYRCAEQVSAPYYTDTSKFINFSLPTGQAAIDDYVQHCPIGTMTNQDGATSASACTALNMSQRYQDETGIFTITSTAQCPDQP